MLQHSSEDKVHISPGDSKPRCVVCDEFTDGQHFGQFCCRACGAFFRRTVAQKLKYVCKFDQNCEISKGIVSGDLNWVHNILGKFTNLRCNVQSGSLGINRLKTSRLNVSVYQP